MERCVHGTARQAVVHGAAAASDNTRPITGVKPPTRSAAANVEKATAPESKPGGRKL